MFRHLRTLEKTDDPRIQLSLADLIYAIGELTRCVMAQGSMDGVDFTRHSKRAVRRELLGYSFTITGPVGRTNKLFGKDLGDICPVGLVIIGVLAVALRSPRFFECKVRRNCNCKELVGPVHKEGFCATCKVRIEHLSMGEAVRDVVDDIAGNFDPKLGSILHLVDLVQRLIHRIFEVF